MSDKQKNDAVIRRFEIIGEAANRLPDSLKEEYLEVPWRKISGLRNKLVHEYADIDFKLIWDVSQKELSELKEQVKRIMEKYLI